MTYIISGYNPRAGLRGGDWFSDMMKDPAGYATAQAQKAAQAAADAAAVAVGLKPDQHRCRRSGFSPTRPRPA